MNTNTETQDQETESLFSIKERAERMFEYQMAVWERAHDANSFIATNANICLAASSAIAGFVTFSVLDLEEVPAVTALLICGVIVLAIFQFFFACQVWDTRSVPAFPGPSNRDKFFEYLAKPDNEFMDQMFVELDSATNELIRRADARAFWFRWTFWSAILELITLAAAVFMTQFSS